MTETFEEYKKKIEQYVKRQTSDIWRYSDYIDNIKFFEIEGLIKDAYEQNCEADRFLRNVYRYVNRPLKDFSDLEITNEISKRNLWNEILKECDTDDLVWELDDRCYFQDHDSDAVWSTPDAVILDIVHDRNLIPTTFAEYIGANNSFAYTKDELKQLAIDYIDKNF